MSLKTLMLVVEIKTAKRIEHIEAIQKHILESDMDLLAKTNCNILINEKMKELGKVFER